MSSDLPLSRLALKTPVDRSCFLWGALQTGKSTLLKDRFPAAKRYDLLLSDTYQRLLKSPHLIREECEALGLSGDNQRHPIIIDEVQKLPMLLDEVHWMMENRGLRFILSGSSARKIKRGQGNLLGGRAIRYELHPLVSQEINDFDLDRALNHGLLPPHYLSNSPRRLLRGYVGDYLREEIVAEALIRNVQAFSRFLDVAALSNGELINYTNIASDCGVSSPTVKEYYQILVDTLVGNYLPAFRKRAKRRLVESPKFYFFDVGVVAELTRRKQVESGTELFGRAFEHFLWMELRAHAEYSEQFFPITYWRTSSQFEVDFILGDNEVAIEAKASALVHEGHLKG